MSFTCDCELGIEGGSPEERRTAAGIVMAADCVDEGRASRRELVDCLVLRFASVDGLPEDELAAAVPQFPGLSFTLAYFSRDGEFYGYARSSAAGSEAESEDFDEGTLETLAADYEGDGIALVRTAFGLVLSGG